MRLDLMLWFVNDRGMMLSWLSGNWGRSWLKGRVLKRKDWVIKRD